jgi:endonuclease/exonuclease/phosphatase family metal-dependent hydrolase
VSPVFGKHVFGSHVLGTIVDALTIVPEEERQGFLDGPFTAERHAAAMWQVAAMGEVEVGGADPRPHAGATVRVGAWNVERCLYPQACAETLRRHGADLVLLSELDDGCHRTGQRHTTREIATALGHGYAYAVEFLELATMPQPIPMADTTPRNRLGFHGNALTSAIPFDGPIVIRLDEVADWWSAPKGSQRRVGTRMAVATRCSAAGIDFVACSVHLESASDEAGRARQMTTLLDAIDAYAQELPIIIGGDLNVAVEPGGHTDPRELLFATAASRGYDWSRCNRATPTTRPSVWSTGAGTRQLDWFCTRGLVAEAPEVVPSIAADGTVLSDHDLLLVTIQLG